MAESVRDLAVWYPFMPAAGTKPGWVDRILDLRLVVILPEADLDHMDRAAGHNESIVTAQLESFDSSHARIKVLSPVYSEAQDMTVPIYSGRDAVPTTASYMVVEEDFSDSDSDCGLEVHPGCLVLLQEAPKLGFMTRNVVSSVDGRVDDSDPSRQTRIDGADYSDSVYYPTKLDNGHNVEVYLAGESIVFNASPGAGLGVYTDPPYTDVHTYSVQPSRGLRSINGLSGTVMISSGPSVDESTSYEEPVITLRVAPSNEGD